MTLNSLWFYLSATRSDRKRDAAIPLPAGVTQYRNISYGSHGNDNLLDVYLPEGTQGPLPTIVSIHGGGYVYGTKEIYRRYGMDMARRGFAFVNFNYRRAPKWQFPTPLADTNHVMEWIVRNAEQYHLDPDRIFLVGDSAGAQMACQYAAMQTNPEYGNLFRLKPVKVTIRAVALNCGLYDLKEMAAKPRKGMHKDYFGKIPAEDPRFCCLEAIRDNYPPTFITTGTEDFLRELAQPMYDYLQSRYVEADWKCYGQEGDKTVCHVFHVNILLPEAVQCNDDTARFFRKYI